MAQRTPAPRPGACVSSCELGQACSCSRQLLCSDTEEETEAKDSHVAGEGARRAGEVAAQACLAQTPSSSSPPDLCVRCKLLLSYQCLEDRNQISSKPPLPAPSAEPAPSAQR